MMQKVNKILVQPLKIYLVSIFFSLLLFFPFDRLYVAVLHPMRNGGNSLFFPFPELLGEIINGSIYASFFIMTLFISIYIPKNKIFVWSIGILIPFSVAISSGYKDILFSIVLISLGWICSKLFLEIKPKKQYR